MKPKRKNYREVNGKRLPTVNADVVYDDKDAPKTTRDYEDMKIDAINLAIGMAKLIDSPDIDAVMTIAAKAVAYINAEEI